MKLGDIVKTLDEMSEDELQERLRAIRHRRTVERPVAKAREAKIEKRESRGRMTDLDRMLSKLKPEERQALIDSLEIGNEQTSEGSGQG